MGRLLRESCRTQSFGTIEVHPVAPDPVAAKIEDTRERLIYRDAAGLAASPEPAQQKHPVAEIAELLRERLELLPVLTGIRGEPSTPSRPW